MKNPLIVQLNRGLYEGDPIHGPLHEDLVAATFRGSPWKVAGRANLRKCRRRIPVLRQHTGWYWLAIRALTPALDRCLARHLHHRDVGRRIHRHHNCCTRPDSPRLTSDGVQQKISTHPFSPVLARLTLR